MGKVKNIVSKILVSLITSLNLLNQKFTENSYNPNPNSYEHLAPTDDADEGGEYSDALIWAIKNESINNIALSGPFGSGKSSVLRSFKKKHSEFEYLNISLACFNDGNDKDISNSLVEKSVNDEIDKDINNSLVEKSVLQQIFYQVKGNEIPYSRFERIKGIKSSDLVATTFGLIGWLSAVVYLYNPTLTSYKSILKSLGHNQGNAEFISLLSLSVVAIGFFFIVKSLISFVISTRLSKIKSAVGEIVLYEGSEASALNKHLDEILYFFEKTKYNVVVVEDLDRFDEIDIFSKLREINGLINSSSQVNRKVTFIYAIKDDLFQGKDRTKFFDYIIPVIPVINSSNSEGKLLEKLSESGLLESITKGFLSEVTIYIDDMRILKNIYNEFVIYKNKLSAIDLNTTNLFGFIIYKNIFPGDFAKLQNDEGIVAEAFKNKNVLVHNHKSEITAEISQITTEIEIINKEHLNTIKELRSVYLIAIANKAPNITSIHLNNQQVCLGKAVEDNYFSTLINERNIQYYIINNNRAYPTGTSFGIIENEVNPKATYSEREKSIKLKGNGKVEDLKIKLEKLRTIEREVESFSLKEFTDEFPDENIFPDANKAEYGLLYFLIENGYINEMYHSFISHFYEGALMKNDIDFILSVKNKKALSPEHTLTHVREVIKRFNRKEFHKPEVLNFALLDFLLESEESNHIEFLEVLIEQLANSSNKSTEFINIYMDVTRSKSNFINKLCSAWSGLWTYITLESNYTLNKQHDYLIQILSHADIKNILSINKDWVLGEFISNLDGFLNLVAESNIETLKVEEVIYGLDVKFKSIENPAADEHLFEFIYENNLYDINSKMIELFANYENNTPPIEGGYFKPNYSNILSFGQTNLSDYINDNLTDYINNVYLNIEGPCNEDEHSILSLLNNEEISDQLKDAIIDKATFSINDITDVNYSEQVWSNIINASKVNATWGNIINYYLLDREIDEELANFFNLSSNYNNLSKSDLSADEVDDKGVITDLSESIVNSPKITDEAYSSLIKSIPSDFNITSVEEISESKLEILIKLDQLSLTQEIISSLSTKSINLCALLIKRNLDVFIKTFYDLDSTPIIIQTLLMANDITIDKKFEIIEMLDPLILEDNQSITDQIYNILLNMDKCTEIDIQLLLELIKQGRLENQKVRLATKQIPTLDDNEITQSLECLGGDYSELTSGKRPSFKNNTENHAFAIALKDAGYITSFSISEDNGSLRMWPKGR